MFNVANSNNFSSNSNNCSWWEPQQYSNSNTLRFPDIKPVKKGNDKVLNTAENLEALLKDLGYTIQKNAMNLELDALKGDEVKFNSFESLRSDLIGWCERNSLPKTSIDDHIGAIAERNSVHPVRAWLETGDWDGVKRVNKVIACLNAQNNEAAQMVLHHWLIGCVASLYEPRFSSKLVPILQGLQSYMKTAALSRICDVIDGAFLEGAELNPENKDSVLSVIKSFITELGELERTSKNCQGSLKTFITKSVDSVRPPYGRTDIHKPRQTHLIGTVNGKDFLKDETGSSRYAVIELAAPVNIDELNRLLGWTYINGRVELKYPDRLRQFWLEIKHDYDSGMGWNLSREQVAEISSQNDKFQDKGNWYELLRDKYVNVDDSRCKVVYFKAGEVCERERVNKGLARQFGLALKRLATEGLIESRKVRSNGTEYGLKIPKQPNFNVPY